MKVATHVKILEKRYEQSVKEGRNECEMEGETH
jgi:hypothetical protein